MLHVETGDVVLGPSCRCCERLGRTAFGFVHRASEVIAFYYAWMDPHIERRVVSLAISLGDWSHGGDVQGRRAAAFRFAMNRGEIEGEFVDPAESPFLDRDVLGAFLSVSEVMPSVMRAAFLDCAEAIVLEDPEVNVHLAP